MTDITESAAWQRGVEAAKNLAKAPVADVGKDREDKWRRIVNEAIRRREANAANCHTGSVEIAS